MKILPIGNSTLGLVNILVKFETKTIFTPETDLYKLFESDVEVDNIGDPDAKIMWWHVAPYIQYEQMTR